MDELREQFRQLTYRQGRLEQTQWIVDALTRWIQSHRDVVERTPWEFRAFLSDLANRMFIEANQPCEPDGTRSVAGAQVIA